MAQWTYSDWITYASGSATRLSQLRLHIQEVSDKISEGNVTDGRKTHSYDPLQPYLDTLLAKEKAEAAAVDVASGAAHPFTRGRAI